MKNLKSYKSLVMSFLCMWAFFNSNHAFAQNNVPDVVNAAFAKKYPGAEVKKWKSSNNCYTAKAKDGRHTYTATFDQQGNWLYTVTKVGWLSKLPPAIKAGFNKSRYKTWNIYSVKIIDKPSGQFYRVIVDDRNRPVDILHQNLVTEKRVLEIRSDGELIGERDYDEHASL